MELSIIIVNWNTEKQIDQCLKSVYENMSGIRAEVIVIDNRSADGSVPMIQKKYPGVKLISNDENVGFASANNQGMKKARGQYFLLLNPDTVVLKNALKTPLNYMNSHPDVGILGCQALDEDGRVQDTCFRYPSLLNLILSISKLRGLSSWIVPRIFGRERMMDWKRDSERDVDVVTGCYLFTRRDAVNEVGLMDKRFFLYAEETDWCRRFHQMGWKVRFIPEAKIIHKGNEGAKQITYIKSVLLTRSVIQYFRKYHGPIYAWIGWFMFLGGYVSRWTISGLIFLANPAENTRSRHQSFWKLLTHAFVYAPIKSESWLIGRLLVKNYQIARLQDKSLKKVLVVCSKGGHWIQMSRIIRGLRDVNITFAVPMLPRNISKHYRSYFIIDANRWTKWRIILSALQVIGICLKEKPHVVITTGAAPGVFAMIGGRIVGAKTLWIDSVANVERLSLSGRLAAYLSDSCVTQWKHLTSARGRASYHGSIL